MCMIFHKKIFQLVTATIPLFQTPQKIGLLKHFRFLFLPQSARTGSRRLASLSPKDRAEIIKMIADGLITRENDIMAANKKDLEAATRDGITGPMFSRLALSRYL